MKVIYPVALTDATLDASNVAETDYSAWDVGTAYTTGNNVIVTTGVHKVYEAVTGGTGHDPTTDDGTYWIEVGATNRWKAFDGFIADQVSNSGTITYSIIPTGVVTGIAFFGLSATSVRVQVTDTTPTVIYDQTVDLVDGTGVVDWFTFFTEALVYDTEALLIDLPCYAGYTLDITISAGAGTAKVGQIVFGRVINLGETVDGTRPGYKSYSVKSTDAFGRTSFVQRAIADRVEFIFVGPTADQRRIGRVVKELDTLPAVWFADADMIAFGVMVYGVPSAYSAPLSAGGTTFFTLEIEGQT